MELEFALIDEAGKYSDWHVNIANPSKTVLFPGPVQLPEKLVPVAAQLAEAIKEAAAQTGRDRFVVQIGSEHCLGIRFRAQHMTEGRYAARTLPKRTPPLDKLGFGAYAELEFMSDALKDTGGLVLVAGATGSGKTTTISSIVSSRLSKYGGYAIAVEDPPEFPLEGFHGQGYCESMDASDRGYTSTLVDALRCFPSGNPAMLLYGEVREAQAASELLRVGIDGHLVFSTVHAKDIETSLMRLISLAEKDGETDPYGLLASSLKIIAHQRIVQGPDGHPVRQMKLVKVGDIEAAMIRDKNIKGLAERSGQQQRLMQGHRQG